MTKKLLNLLAGLLVLGWVFIISPTPASADHHPLHFLADFGQAIVNFGDTVAQYTVDVIAPQPTPTPEPEPEPTQTIVIPTSIPRPMQVAIPTTAPLPTITPTPAPLIVLHRLFISNYEDFRTVNLPGDNGSQTMVIEYNVLNSGHTFDWTLSTLNSQKRFYFKGVYTDGAVSSTSYIDADYNTTRSISRSGTTPEGRLANLSFNLRIGPGPVTPTAVAVPTATPQPTVAATKRITSITVAGRYLLSPSGTSMVSFNPTISRVAPVTVKYSDGTEDFKIINFARKTNSAAPTPTPRKDTYPSNESRGGLEAGQTCYEDNAERNLRCTGQCGKCGTNSGTGEATVEICITFGNGNYNWSEFRGRCSPACASYCQEAAPAPNITSVKLDGTEMINSDPISFSVYGRRDILMSVLDSSTNRTRIATITLISTKSTQSTPSNICSPGEYRRVCSKSCVNGRGIANIVQCNSTGTRWEDRDPEPRDECASVCGITLTPTPTVYFEAGRDVRCTKGAYDVQCTGIQAGCASNAGEARVYQCNSQGTNNEYKYTECNTKCAGSGSGSTPNSPTTPGNGTACTYPETCTKSNNQGGVRTCHGSYDGGVCKYNPGINPDCTTCQ